MTKDQIIDIVTNTLKDNVDNITPLLDARYITLTKFENKYIGVDRTRFKFDTTNEILECYHVRPWNSEIPSDWVYGLHYDTFNDKNYQYLCDSNKNPIIDYYDFEAIMLIAMN